MPSDTNRFVFNGDIVDRGPMALEILLVLLAAKLCNADAMHILRGNHESLIMMKNYGFLQEVLTKYDKEVFVKCVALFTVLPLGAVLEDSVFITHGGISQLMANASIADLNAIDLKLDNFDKNSGIATEMMWSDPMDKITGFRPSLRDLGVRFGKDITEGFLQRNHLNLLIRSHELKQDGYHLQHDGRTLTVFSAPSYCGLENNKGAVVRFNGNALLTEAKVTYEIKTFSHETAGNCNVAVATKRLTRSTSPSSTEGR